MSCSFESVLGILKRHLSGASQANVGASQANVGSASDICDLCHPLLRKVLEKPRALCEQKSPMFLSPIKLSSDFMALPNSPLKIEQAQSTVNQALPNINQAQSNVNLMESLELKVECEDEINDQSNKRVMVFRSFYGLCQSEAKGGKIDARPVLGLMALERIQKNQSIVSCRHSCIFVEHSDVCSNPNSKNTMKRTQIIGSAVRQANLMREQKKLPLFSYSKRYEIAATDGEYDVVGSPSYSYYYCINSVDDKNISAKAANCKMAAKSFDRKNQSLYFKTPCDNSSVLFEDPEIIALRDIEPGEEIILDRYTNDKKLDYRWNILGVIPENVIRNLG